MGTPSGCGAARGTSGDLIACSGARTKELYDFNSSGTSTWQKPQIRAVDPGRTTLALLGVGGNDVGFADILTDWTAGTGAGGTAGCRERLTSTAQKGLDDLVAGTPTARPMHSVYVDVAKRLAPGGRLVVTGGRPTGHPDTGCLDTGCLDVGAPPRPYDRRVEIVITTS